MSIARARSLATRMARRSRRSASTPTSGLASVGTRRATRRPPTAEALSERSTTRITSATVETKSPTKEIPCPIQSRKNRTFLRSVSPPFIFLPEEGVRVVPAPQKAGSGRDSRQPPCRHPFYRDRYRNTVRRRTCHETHATSFSSHTGWRLRVYNRLEERPQIDRKSVV